MATVQMKLASVHVKLATKGRIVQHVQWDGAAIRIASDAVSKAQYPMEIRPAAVSAHANRISMDDSVINANGQGRIIRIVTVRVLCEFGKHHEFNLKMRFRSKFQKLSAVKHKARPSTVMTVPIRSHVSFAHWSCLTLQH